MTTSTGGVPLRTAIVLIAAALTAIVAVSVTYRENRSPSRALLAGGAALVGSAVFFDWLLYGDS